MMGIALGVLRWPPEAFWNATTHELNSAIEALSAEHANRDGRMTLEELNKLEEWDRNRGRK